MSTSAPERSVQDRTASVIEEPKLQITRERAAESDSGIDRRKHPRQDVVRTCKVLHERFGALLAATTSNVSVGGALLCMERVRPLAAGDRVQVAIDWRGVGVLEQGALMPARVIRVTAMDHHQQAVAIAYDHAALAANAAAA